MANPYHKDHRGYRTLQKLVSNIYLQERWQYRYWVRTIIFIHRGSQGVKSNHVHAYKCTGRYFLYFPQFNLTTLFHHLTNSSSNPHLKLLHILHCHIPSSHTTAASYLKLDGQDYSLLKNYWHTEGCALTGAHRKRYFGCHLLRWLLILYFLPSSCC